MDLVVGWIQLRCVWQVLMTQMCCRLVALKRRHAPEVSRAQVWNKRGVGECVHVNMPCCLFRVEGSNLRWQDLSRVAWHTSLQKNLKETCDSHNGSWSTLPSPPAYFPLGGCIARECVPSSPLLMPRSFQEENNKETRARLCTRMAPLRACKSWRRR